VCRHATQQVTDVDIGVTVIAVRNIGALAKQGIGLVEEQHGVQHVG
jgi:hypothetical protein